MGYVYLITNDINDNKYVGITTRTIEMRWKEHLRHQDEVIGKVIKKYGSEHFKIEKIEECSDGKLDEREKYWIKYYNSYNNGYNCTAGGRRESQIKKPDKFDEVKQLWEEGFGQREIQKITSLNVETVHSYLLKNGITEADINQRFREKVGSSKSIPIQQLDIEGNFIQNWKSAAEVEKKLNINARNIRSVCQGKRKTAGNFKWKYLEDKNG